VVERKGLDEELSAYGKRIRQTIEAFLERKKHELESANWLGKDLTERLRRFSTGGKLIRGSLILLTHDMLSSKLEDDFSAAGLQSAGCEAVAAAYELIHSFLLIHDDIMDRDRFRRGMPSIYFQYQTIIEENSRGNGLHEAEGLGICAGDVAFLLALELLSTAAAGVYPEKTMKILLLWSRELSRVGVAQMQDVFFSTWQKEASESDIISLYRFKTARYTFSVPFATGSILAGSEAHITENLLDLGEHYGMIYQLVDDKIGLFGEAEKIGKPVGTDLQEKKQTLLHHYLYHLATAEQKQNISKILRKDRITGQDIVYIRSTAIKNGTVQRVEEAILEMKKKAEEMLKDLPVTQEYRRILGDMLEYSIKRER